MRNCLVCFGEATELHHIYPRSSYPEKVGSKDNVMWVCRACHANIHASNTQKLRQTLYNRNQIMKRTLPERFMVEDEDIRHYLKEED